MSSTLKLHVLATPLTRLRNRATNSIIGPAREQQWNRIWNKRPVHKIIPGVGGRSVSVGYWHCSSHPLKAAKWRLETHHLANSWDTSQKQVSWKLDKVPLKSTNQTSVCLLIVFLIESESSITSPPKNKNCCLKRRDVKNRTNTASAGPRIPLFIYERISFPYKITDIGSLRRFASETWHMNLKACDLDPYSCFYHELSVQW